MASTTLHYYHPITKDTKVAHVGLSWTALFFGFYVALFRQDFKAVSWLVITSVLTLGLAQFYYWLTYNSAHRNRLVKSGYKLIAKKDYKLLIPMFGKYN